MRTNPPRVLLVEDNPDHAKLIRRHLLAIRPRPAQVEWATSFAGAQVALSKSQFDAILLDLRLPDSGLEDTLPRMVKLASHLPVIALTSLEELDFAVNAVKQGAQDYLVKSSANEEVLARSIHYSIERKRGQQELQRHTAALERINRELDHFTHVVSHDLKSPLAVIEMELQSIVSKSDLAASEVSERIRGALQTAAQMRKLIDDLLRYARTGAEIPDIAQINLDQLVERAVEELNPLIAATGSIVTFDALPSIEANELQLAQVLNNLITNAIKYHGDQPPRIHISAEFLPPDWVFTVRDEGMGIPESEHERIFELFTRLHHGSIPGSGIGLATCKRIIESHGGRIWVDSEPGRGSTFYFTLPHRVPARSAPASQAVSSEPPLA